MRNARLVAVTLAWKSLIVAAVAIVLGAPVRAAEPSLDELLSGVVHIKTFINPDGLTRENLGREREGTGIVLDNAGLVLTIGYLMVEAHAAEITTNAGHTVPASVVGYDNETGFGLLQAITPLKVRPMAMGKSSEREDRRSGADRGLWRTGRPDARPMWSPSGNSPAIGNTCSTRRSSPRRRTRPGVAPRYRSRRQAGRRRLADRQDTSGKGSGAPGNMFVPIDQLPPILGDLIAEGHPLQPAHPWLGLNTDEVGGHLVVSRVTPGAPAEKAGMRRGDIIVGVNGETPTSLPDLYRKIWAQGAAGAHVSLDVLHEHERRHVDVLSINRLDQLKLKSTF